MLRERGETRDESERGGRSFLVCWFAERGVSRFGERIERDRDRDRDRDGEEKKLIKIRDKYFLRLRF